MKNIWKVVYDGPSLAMIQSPTGEILRIQVWNGKWQNALLDDKLHEIVCSALNMAQVEFPK